MSIAIIDYGSGNLRSAQKAVAHMAGGRDVVLTQDPEMVARADHIILPGVGAFGDCLAGLQAIDGMWQALNEAVIEKGQPFLGICVGLQLMCRLGVERGRFDGLGWFDAEVRPLPVAAPLKVPHMGWNNLSLSRPHAVFDGLDGADMYFVHGFAATDVTPIRDIAATVSYGTELVAALARDNMVGTQFHPEKSQQAGLQLIGNFLEWRP